MALQRIPAGELCDARFLASLEHLRIVAKRVAPRGLFAEQRSRDKGSGIEFKDYRPYSAGDDLRGVDWNVYSLVGPRLSALKRHATSSFEKLLASI